jgi:hypothetical protein
MHQLVKKKLRNCSGARVSKWVSGVWVQIRFSLDP